MTDADNDAAQQERGANDGLQHYVDLATGLTRTTLSTTERLLAQIARLDDVVARSVEGSDALARVIRSEVDHAVERAGFVRAEEVAQLRREIERLRARLGARDDDPTATGGEEARPAAAAPGSTEAET
jgi:uncharacterized membrane protein YccC